MTVLKTVVINLGRFNWNFGISDYELNYCYYQFSTTPLENGFFFVME